MGDFVINDGVLVQYNGKDTDVVIPEGVTAIGDGVFHWKLNSVVLPEGLKRIGSGAFRGCAFDSIVLPDSLEQIDQGAFKWCALLTSIVIPKGVTSIEYDTFGQCGALMSVVIPEGVTRIKENAFWGCKSLTSVVIPDGVTEIGSTAFWECESLTSVVIPDSVKKIGRHAFEKCIRLKELVIPDSVTSIEAVGNFSAFCETDDEIVYGGNWVLKAKRTISGDLVLRDGTIGIADGAFVKCELLKSVVLPETVITIGGSAFEGCRSLCQLTVPDSLKEIGYKALSGCIKLTEFSCPPALKESVECLAMFNGPVPAGMVSQFEHLAPLLEYWDVETFFLRKAAWKRLSPAAQAAIFIAHHNERLTKSYRSCIEDPDVLGRALAERLTGETFGEPHEAAIAFLTLFGTQSSADTVRSLYTALKANPEVGNRLKPIEKNAYMMTLAAENEGDTVEQLSLPELPMSEKEIRKSLKGWYKVGVEELPGLLDKNKVPLDPLYFAYLIVAHEGEYGKTVELAPEAVAILECVDAASLQQALMQLADRYLGTGGRKDAISYPICRYADEETMRVLTARSTKWRSRESGINSYTLLFFREGLVYSQTRAAMLCAEKYGDMDDYAKLRGTDADTIRDAYMSDVGLDADGRRVYDLGNQTVTAVLQSDLKIGLTTADGKTVKSLPKRGADEQKYAEAAEHLTDMKKSIKKIVNARKDQLFEAFLSGKGRAADGWSMAYLNNPLLRSVARLLVWEQGGTTFTVGDDGLVTVDGTAYILGDAQITVAHPMDMPDEEVAAWQQYFVTRGLKQPFEQVWEPVADFDKIEARRYEGALLPYYCFLGQTKHGITVVDEDFHNQIEITFEGCQAEVFRHDYARHRIERTDRFEIVDFSVSVRNKRTNHLVGYLDRCIVRSLILRNDVTAVIPLLHAFTAAQIAEFIALAAENECTNVTAALLEYQQKNEPDVDPFAEFVLE